MVIFIHFKTSVLYEIDIMAAAIKSTQKAESLEKKFFDLVVQPNQSNEDSKVKSLPEKNALKLEKKRRLVHR